ncbi:MAG TPA: hypothetical protein VIU42_04930 [Xanthobacteraceae bacterium]
MRWPLRLVSAAAGTAFLAALSSGVPARAADAGLAPAAETRFETNRTRLVRLEPSRRYVIRTYRRCHTIWHVDASSANPAYRLC